MAETRSAISCVARVSNKLWRFRQQRRGDARHLIGRFALTENHFRHAMPDGAMVIDFRESQVFKGQVAQRFERGRNARFAAMHLFEKFFNLLNIHLLTRNLRRLKPQRHPIEW